MASKITAIVGLFLTLNLLLSVLALATVPCPLPPPRKPKPAPCNTCGAPKPPISSPGRGSSVSCPRDALKLGVCANLLGLANVVLGSPPTKPCCSLLEGLTDLEAAVCLCTAIKGNVLGINLNVPVSLSLLLNACGKSKTKGFQCA